MSSRVLGHLAVVIGLLVLTGRVLRADVDKAEIRPFQIKKGSDFAPAEQRVSIRNHADYRRPDGILAQAKHAPVRVDAHSLYRRRLDMYAGRSYTESLVGQPVSVTPTVLAVAAPEAPTETSRDWKTIVAISLPLVVFGGFFIWWRRQMKHAADSRAQLIDLRRRRRAPKRRGSRTPRVRLNPRFR